MYHSRGRRCLKIDIASQECCVVRASDNPHREHTQRMPSPSVVDMCKPHCLHGKTTTQCNTHGVAMVQTHRKRFPNHIRANNLRCNLHLATISRRCAHHYGIITPVLNAFRCQCAMHMMCIDELRREVWDWVGQDAISWLARVSPQTIGEESLAAVCPLAG